MWRRVFSEPGVHKSTSTAQGHITLAGFLFRKLGENTHQGQATGVNWR
jgi:hypothetical protein